MVLSQWLVFKWWFGFGIGDSFDPMASVRLVGGFDIEDGFGPMDSFGIVDGFGIGDGLGPMDSFGLGGWFWPNG